jgi:hypothetical protein
MSNARTLQEQIATATDRLATLKARELLAKAKERAKAKATARRADAHRKIALGGLVIAAGAADLDEAELVGALLAYQERVAKPEAASQRDTLRARGRAHLAARMAARKPGSAE